MVDTKTTLFITTLIYTVIHLSLLLSIIWVTYRTIIEFKKRKSKCDIKRKKIGLFIFGLIFNFVTFLCIFALFFKVFSKSVLVSIGYDIDINNRLSMGCRLVYLQNSFLLIVLFIRICSIFDQSPALKLSIKTIIFSISLYIFSCIIFIILSATKYNVIPGTNSFITCAVILCVFNGCFMIIITSLFISKLSIVVKDSANSDHQNKRQNALINLIIKTALLSTTAMLITFISCIFLLSSMMKMNNIYINIVSDWIVTINLYSNFLCYSLQFTYFHRGYIKLCKCIDLKCKKIWYRMIFGGDDIILLTQSIIDINKSEMNVVDNNQTMDKSEAMDTTKGANTTETKDNVVTVTVSEIEIV